MKKTSFWLTMYLLILSACGGFTSEKGILEEILDGREDLFGEILKAPDQFEIQIIYTQIDRDSLNQPKFTTHHYNVDPEKYFYPASTVKLPVSVLALEKLNELGDLVDLETTLLIDSTRESQSTAYSDSTSKSGLPTISHYIKKILLVSDNDAYNRLYEFVGQQEINEKLWKKGFTKTRISHRLSIPMSVEENQYTNPWRLLKDDSVMIQGGQQKSDLDLSFPQVVLKGKGYIKGDSLIEEPMDFTNKNFFPLEDQHELLKSLIFPEETGNRFQLSYSDYDFLRRYMSMLPRESTYPNYSDLPDNYVKFLMFGTGKQTLPTNIRIFNKVGQAYGYLIDNAYITDEERGIEFLLTAVIHTNKNQVFNDGVYEYDEVGFPFLENLGKAIYDYEASGK